MEEIQDSHRNALVLRVRTEFMDWVAAHKLDLGLLMFSILATLATCLHYISTMQLWTYPGFPLDDSWIHIQYARTIYEGIPWQYSPDVPSTGSTSPLWSIILSSLFFLTDDPVYIIWGTYVIAIVLYAASTFFVGKITQDYAGQPVWSLLAMGGFVLVPGNTWLMLSGMEAPIFVFLLVLAVFILDKRDIKYDPILGIILGLAYLARPEGVVLVLVCVPVRFLMVVWHRELSWRRLGAFLLMGAVSLAVVLPWILYCLNTTGYPLPDTFYVKVHLPTEAGVEAWNIWWWFWLRSWPFLWVAFGGGLVLAIKGKPFPWLVAWSLTLLYRFTMPYQALVNNTRYLIPAHALFLVVAVTSTAFMLEWVLSLKKYADIKTTARLATVVFIIGVLIVPMQPLYLRQAQTFGNATKNINDMQVTIGEWIEENTPEDAVLAICDAGAVRFFGNRAVIDIIGLVTPDIVHGNMTTRETLQYMYDRGCDYIVFFDDWFWVFGYHIGGALTTLYSVELDDNIICGRDAMSVYHINWTLTSFS